MCDGAIGRTEFHKTYRQCDSERYDYHWTSLQAIYRIIQVFPEQFLSMLKCTRIGWVQSE